MNNPRRPVFTLFCAIVSVFALSAPISGARADEGAFSEVQMSEFNDSVQCIGAVCIGTMIQVIHGPYAGDLGQVVSIERNTQMLTVINRFNQYIYPRYGEVRPAPSYPGRPPVPGRAMRSQGEMDGYHFNFVSPRADRREILHQCLNFGARLHLRFVNRVVVNGNAHYQFQSIDQACSFVMRMAR